MPCDIDDADCPRGCNRGGWLQWATIARRGLAFSDDRVHPIPVERGGYLVTLGGCNDCHTPLMMGPAGPEPDMSRMLSGHPESMPMPDPPELAPDAPWNVAIAATATAFAGPWGVSYAANLTPDQNTGMGIWTEEMFMTAMRKGIHMGTSRPILPLMPWQGIGKASDDDLRAIFAYLRSIPSVTNHVPDPVILAPLPESGQ